MTAAGTAGYGDELAGYGDLGDLGALVTKSLAHFAHEGNPAPRVVAEGADMLNSVGLAGPGIEA
ncbi:MAG: dihydroorotate dehydrogenase, partial [Acidobacteria bacterium]|nr:dihydroorotate dehydrogenase [Acidobacteriota bacterium]